MCVNELLLRSMSEELRSVSVSDRDIFLTDVDNILLCRDRGLKLRLGTVIRYIWIGGVNKSVCSHS